MNAVLKGDAMKYVEWNGIGRAYPEWFHQIVPLLYSDAGDIHVVLYDDGIKYIQPGDIFILNKNNKFKYLTRSRFNEHMVMVNYFYCALRKDILHYEMGYDFVQSAGGNIVKEEYVELYNNAGEENVISVYDFKDLFEFGRY